MAVVAQWTEELFAEMSAKYVAQIEQHPVDERPGVSMEIVNELAKEHGVTPNSFRMKLSKEGLYIKKEAGKASAGTATDKPAGGARTSKATAHAELKAAFSDAGLDLAFLDEAIVEKLTGKAAAHLAEAVRKITK